MRKLLDYTNNRGTDVSILIDCTNGYTLSANIVLVSDTYQISEMTFNKDLNTPKKNRVYIMNSKDHENVSKQIMRLTEHYVTYYIVLNYFDEIIK